MKTFYFYKRKGKVYRKKIGLFPTISIKFAREKVIELKNQLAKVQNHLPKEQNQLLLEMMKELKAQLSKSAEGAEVNNTGIMFSVLCDKYINDYRKLNTKGWENDLKELNTKSYHFLDKKVSDIFKKDVLDLFNEITVNNGKFAANKFIILLNALFNFGIVCEYISVNPAKGIRKYQEEARDRYITKEKMPKFINAVMASDNQQVKDFILIALYYWAKEK